MRCPGGRGPQPRVGPLHSEPSARGPPPSRAPRAGGRLDPENAATPGRGRLPSPKGRTAATEGAGGPARLHFELGCPLPEAELRPDADPRSGPGPCPAPRGSGGPVSSPPANATSSKRRSPYPAWRAPRPARSRPSRRPGSQPADPRPREAGGESAASRGSCLPQATAPAGAGGGVETAAGGRARGPSSAAGPPWAPQRPPVEPSPGPPAQDAAPGPPCLPLPVVWLRSPPSAFPLPPRVSTPACLPSSALLRSTPFLPTSSPAPTPLQFFFFF